MEPMSDASTSEQYLMNHASKLKIPINGSLELLPLCNMNCDMCYVRLSASEASKRGRIKTAEEWLSLGKELQEAGTVFLLLTGGEPLLHPEFKKIYMGFKSMGMILTINTNGTLIDETWAKFFAENPPRRINITLYGVNKETYRDLCHYEEGYNRTLNAIQLLRERSLDVRVGCSVTNRNKNDLERFFEICHELDVAPIADTYMVSATRERERRFNYDSRLSPEEAAKYRMFVLEKMYGKENFKTYVKQKLFEIDNILPEDEPGKVSCYAGNCSFAISWLGEMHPCVTMTSPVANVFELGFVNAWKSIENQTSCIRTSVRCQKCNLRTICKNCAGNALVETGDYNGTPEYLCRLAREQERLLRIEAEKLKE